MPTLRLDGARLPWPTNWPAVFGRAGPLLVEIGFGSGGFLVELARRHPQANVLGVEIALPSLRRAEDKVRRAGLHNVRLVHGRAPPLLWAATRPHTLGGLTLNFPDPWPKAGHQRRRLVDARFLHLAATRLQPGSPLDVATDHADYAAAIAACLEATPYFTSRTGRPYETHVPGRPPTKYEQKALAAGRACHYFLWQRNDRPAPDAFPIPQEMPMPHAILSLPLSLDEIAARFRPHQFAAGPVNVRLAELFHSAQHDTLLVDAYVQEEPLEQRVGLVIRQRAAAEYVVNVHELGFPRPTAGLHTAVRGLAQWLVGLHPAAAVLRHDWPASLDT